MAETQEWEAVDPCYGICPIGSMPCTPEGCPENHPVGRRVLVGPRALEVDADGCVEFESESETLLLAAAPQLLAACEHALSMLDPFQYDVEPITKAINLARGSAE